MPGKNKQRFRYISKKYTAANNIKFNDNAVCNQKYRWYTLPFWVLLQQFKFFFNTYFFVISVTQCIDKFRISSPISSLGPWIVVLIACLFKEAYDDYRRYIRDCSINNQFYIKYSENEGFKRVHSSDIEVGDIILLEKNERIPADMVLLKTSDLTGQIFLRTDQLDGETDWKLRTAVPSTQTAPFEQLKDITVLAEETHKDIYSFKGKLMIGELNESEMANVELEKPKAKSGVFFDSLLSLLNYNQDKKSEEAELLNAPIKSEVYDWVYSSPIIKESEANDTQENLNTNHVEQLKDESINEPIEDNDEVNANHPQSLSLENMIWMNTILASSSALGFVVYTGMDTRVIMNTSKPRNKDSMIDNELNVFSKALGSLAAIVALLFTICQKSKQFSVVTFIKFIVLFSYIIPISLKVTIEMARYVYAYYISKDKNIPGTIVRNSNIPEELGRVSYFLTDKTGTLTKNEMEMKKVHLGTICYTQDLNEEISRNIVKFLTNTEDQRQVFIRGKKDLNTKIFELVQALCVCHNVTPVESDGKLTYQASSPDEVAIVSWTEIVGMRLVYRDRNRIVIQDNIDENQVYEILYIFPFTSETKRMGIIVRYNGEILFFMKGADVVMNKIIKTNDWVEEETENMARDGLRTLVIAKRILSKEDFKHFEKIYGEAKLNLDNRNEAIADAMAFLERDMSVLGLTGVEDKLQDNVKMTLENLRNAGIKVWMLTGDKIETAISIAISSRIFTKNTSYIILSNIDSLDILNAKLREVEAADYDSLIVDGNTLTLIMNNCFGKFIDIISKLDSIVGCRFSPTQKALVARLLRERSKKIICCIGDGGNDVSMITEANVGIGIVGKEGNQASLSADYSINKFCYVSDLFFWHGRNSYMNSVKITHLIIHRGTILSVLQGLLCSIIYFIPFSLYNGVILIAFVTVYTFFPIFSLVTTSDISRDVCFRFPELYKELISKDQLSLREFATWNFVSFYQGVIILTIFFFLKQEMFSISTLTFNSLIINEILMVMLTANRVNRTVVMACIFSLFLYILSFFLFKKQLYIDTQIYVFLGKVLVVNVIALIVSLVKLLFEIYFCPPTYSKLERDF